MRRLIKVKAIASLAAMLLGSALGVGGGCDSESYYGGGYYSYEDDYSYISDYGYGSSNGDYSDAIETYLGNFVSY